MPKELDLGSGLFELAQRIDVTVTGVSGRGYTLACEGRGMQVRALTRPSSTNDEATRLIAASGQPLAMLTSNAPGSMLLAVRGAETWDVDSEKGAAAPRRPGNPYDEAAAAERAAPTSVIVVRRSRWRKRAA